MTETLPPNEAGIFPVTKTPSAMPEESLNYPPRSNKEDTDPSVTKDFAAIDEDEINKSLLEASASGNTKRIREYIHQGADVLTRNETGQTPIHIAAENLQYEAVGVLLEYEKDNAGWTPLHISVQRYSEELVDAILNTGAADISARNNSGSTPLHLACDLETFDIVGLLLAEADKHKILLTELEDNDGQTPLHNACHYGHDNVVKELLWRAKEVGISIIELKDGNGQTPLHIACRYGHHKVVETLLGKAEKDGKSIIELKDGNAQTPLHIACYRRQDHVVGTLLRHGADLQQRDYNGKTPFHLACAEGENRIVLFLLIGRLIGRCPELESHFWEERHTERDVIKSLFPQKHYTERDGIVSLLPEEQYKALVDSIDSDHNTALHLAAREGHYSIVKTLLDAGSNPNATNIFDETPLQLAGKGVKKEKEDEYKKITRLLSSQLDPQKRKETWFHLCVTEEDDTLKRLTESFDWKGLNESEDRQQEI
ncbi:hypothetical protein ACMFMG_001187 [Clarireedia jacksonii]